MLPELFEKKMQGLLNTNEYEKFVSAFDCDDFRHHALRINRNKVTDEEAMLRTLEADKDDGNPLGMEKVPWEERGCYYEDSLSPGKHPYHEAGLYYIQEPSAMAPVHYLDPAPGDRVLDLCAAPGGKSTQIADRLSGRGLLVTNEINRERAKILSLNVERMGIRNAMVLNEDSGHLADVFEGFFDKILVDAPCSGEGMFRKNEIALTEWSPENVELCAGRQSEILDNAARMLLPGGRLVYSTCTFSPEENEETIFKFLMTHRDFHVEKVTLLGGMEYGRNSWVDVQKCLGQIAMDSEDEAVIEEKLNEAAGSVRLWPWKIRGEGHFLCVLVRDGKIISGNGAGYVPGGKPAPVRKEIAAAVMSFARENFKGSAVTDITAGNLLAFGDQIYVTPAEMPSPNGLKVLRPGLHLGTVKKDRFEPSHALALSLNPGDAVLTVDFPSDSDRIRQYLNGQTIRLDESDGSFPAGKKGWCLVTCDGYSIGWAKLSGGLFKNHYPKGLRINY